MFSKPEFKKLFADYFVVKLYTDIVPDDFYAPAVRAQFKGDVARQTDDAREVNFKFQESVFKDLRLPLYVILEPQLDGTIAAIAEYKEGKINNEAAFAEFLRNPR